MPKNLDNYSCGFTAGAQGNNVVEAGSLKTREEKGGARMGVCPQTVQEQPHRKTASKLLDLTQTRGRGRWLGGGVNRQGIDSTKLINRQVLFRKYKKELLGKRGESRVRVPGR